MVNLRMPPGCDEVNHNAYRYRVNPFEGNTVDVRPEVATWLLRTASGAVLADPPAVEEPIGMVRVRHASDRSASFSWRGKSFATDESGVLEIPAAAIGDAISHGFTTTA